FLERIMKTARRGNRVVVALVSPQANQRNTGATLERTWHVRLRTDAGPSHSRRLYFTQAKDWKVLDGVLDNGEPKLLEIERAFDKGTVVLFADSGGFANQSMLRGERLATVTGAIGVNSRIIFDEAHLGIAESGSVMG